MKDSLERYLQLRTALLDEKARLEKRLQQIREALSGVAGTSSPASLGRRAKQRNPMSLREAITQVTKAKPLTKQEILAAIARLGYRFSTDKPVNTLNAVLYSKKQFKNENGRFSKA